MGNKTRNAVIVVAIVAVLTALGFYAYSKYTGSISGDAETTAAAWNIKVNNDTLGTTPTTFTNDITVTPEANSNVASGKVAPGSSASFEVQIDPTGTEVSYNYAITLDDTDTSLPDGMTISGYKVNGGTLQNGSTIDNNILLSTATGTAGQVFGSGDKQTITVYVTWADSTSNNADDTSREGSTITIPVNVTVSQYIS